jgi:hypothetical protein
MVTWHRGVYRRNGNTEQVRPAQICRIFGHTLSVLYKHTCAVMLFCDHLQISWRGVLSLSIHCISPRRAAASSPAIWILQGRPWRMGRRHRRVCDAQFPNVQRSKRLNYCNYSIVLCCDIILLHRKFAAPKRPIVVLCCVVIPYCYNQNLLLPNVQTSKRPNVQTSKRLNYYNCSIVLCCDIIQ